MKENSKLLQTILTVAVVVVINIIQLFFIITNEILLNIEHSKLHIFIFIIIESL